MYKKEKKERVTNFLSLWKRCESNSYCVSFLRVTRQTFCSKRAEAKLLRNVRLTNQNKDILIPYFLKLYQNFCDSQLNPFKSDQSNFNPSPHMLILLLRPTPESIVSMSISFMDISFQKIWKNSGLLLKVSTTTFNRFESWM